MLLTELPKDIQAVAYERARECRATDTEMDPVNIHTSLGNAFDWGNAPEGREYWKGVNEGTILRPKVAYIEEDKDVPDPVHPKHYKSYSVEVIDMMVAIYGKETTADWCELTAFKYRQRMGKKEKIEIELGKEQWYLDKARELRAQLAEEG